MKSVDAKIKSRIPVRHRMFLKVYFNFALVLVVFALVLGFIFMRLYRNTSLDSNRLKMQSQARGVSNSLREFMNNENFYGGLSYLASISTLEQLEIWAIPNESAALPLNRHLVNVDLNGTALTMEQTEVIQSVFRGNEANKTYFSNIHMYTVMTVGVPIINANNEVCGAVLINTELDSIDRAIESIQSVVWGSTLIAMALSFAVAAAFARQLTVPVSKMRATALELAKGNYAAKTNLERKDELGDLAHTIDFLTDKLQENEKERENLEHMRMDFFANVSHELRTPITVVRAYTESLVDGVVTEPVKIAQYYERMLSECKSMERLVGDLLLLSKMQNPDFVIETEPCNLIQIMNDVVRTAGKIAEEKNVSIVVKAERDIYMMYADYDRLRQMFLVILDNAIKFSNENESVFVTIKQDEKLTISILDKGIGISEEELPYVFEKFYKSKLRQNAKGSGLGLAIARQIAIKHGGGVEVTSKPGHGTEFVFTFNYMNEEELERESG